MVTASPTPFQIEVKEGDQQDLQQRLRSTRLPDQQVGVAWEQGTNIRYLEVSRSAMSRRCIVLQQVHTQMQKQRCAYRYRCT